MHEKRVKVILLGESSVGKSSISNQFINADFDPLSFSTVGMDVRRRLFEVKNIENEEEKVCVELWDTAGQERFRTFVGSHFRFSHRALLVFDLTSMASFQQIDYWRKEIERHTDLQKNQMILVGNKVDLVQGPKPTVVREVSTEMAEDYANRHGLVYREVSATDRDGVETLMGELIEMAPLPERQATETVNLQARRGLKKRLCSC